ncbi:MAG: TlpA disulfide reductase family protein [Gammaproteobacteria bacterium]
MKTLLRTTTLAILVGGALPVAFGASGASPDAISGRWDAVLLDNGPPVAFRLDISGTDSSLKGTFYDGFQPYETTTNATFKDGKLVLKAEHYLTTISADLKDGALIGDTELTGPGYHLKYGFRAVRHVDAPAATARNVPSIDGAWEIPLDSPSSKGEKAFRFIVRQKGAEVAASILRVDGDTGAYSGAYKDGKWVLSHFDGQRPGVIEVSARSDGTLDVLAHNEAIIHALQGNDSKGYSEERYGDAAPKYIAYRPEVARSKGFPEPANFLTHTTARDAKERFAFNFPDVNGKPVSNEDFKGKVVLAIVTGTWCPNCHDEAQLLVELDRKYRDKGLAIVALDFEEPEQQDSLVRVHAFVKQYGVKYPYLIAGAPAEMWEKVPQLVNLNTWPATVFVGRDGTVRTVHSGFASRASGQYHAQLRKEFTERIEQLLAEKATGAATTLTDASRTGGDAVARKL